MSLEWGTPEARKFVTNVGLITSNGRHGHNIMSAEWTRHVSYNPPLIMVNVERENATTENILETKVFGIGLASTDQNVLASVAGGSSGKEVDKISLLKELGFEFYDGKEIDVMMVRDSSLNIECKLVKSDILGSHVMLVGEAVDVVLGNKDSLAYYGGKYWKLNEKIEKPSQDRLDKIDELVEKYIKNKSQEAY